MIFFSDWLKERGHWTGLTRYQQTFALMVDCGYSGTVAHTSRMGMQCFFEWWQIWYRECIDQKERVNLDGCDASERTCDFLGCEKHPTRVEPRGRYGVCFWCSEHAHKAVAPTYVFRAKTIVTDPDSSFPDPRCSEGECEEKPVFKERVENVLRYWCEKHDQLVGGVRGELFRMCDRDGCEERAEMLWIVSMRSGGQKELRLCMKHEEERLAQKEPVNKQEADHAD